VRQKLSSIAYIITEFWAIITSVIFVIFIASSVLTRQELMAQRLDKLEGIREDINTIKIKVERIDATLEQINKGK
jgi:hypothetical protein